MDLAILRSRPSAALLRLGIPVLVGAAGVASAAYFLLVHAPRQRADALAALGRDLSLLADVRAQAVDRWALSITQDAGALALEPEAIDLASGLGDPPAARRLEFVLTAYVRTHRPIRAMVFDARLRVVARSRGAGPLDEGDRRAARRALAGSAVVDFDPAPGDPEVAVAVPVRASAPGGGAPIGAVLLEADPKDWLYPFLALRPLDAPSAEAVLIQRDGDSVLFLTPLRFSSAPPLTFRRSLRTPGFAALAALGGGSQFGAFVDYRGVPVYAATRRLTEAPWGLVVKVDQTEALAAERKRLKSQGLFWLGLYGIFAAFLGAVWWGARKALAVGRAEARARTALLLDRANDAFLFIGLDGRITGANRRAEEFYGYPPGALVGKHVVKELRPENERESDRWQFETAFREGRLVFETVHLSASGERLPVEVSSALVSVGDEQSIVSVVRDIRVRKEAEERIRRLSQALRTISKINQLIVRESDAERLFQEACRILVEDGGFSMAWVGAVEPGGRVRPLASAGDSEGYLASIEVRWDDSPAGQGPTGTAIRENRTVALCDLATTEAYAPRREAAAASGFRSSAACPVRRRGAAAAVLSLYASETAVFDAEMLALLEELASDLGFALQAIEDRAERERAEEALKTSSQLLRDTGEMAQVGGWELDLSTKQVSWTEEVGRIHGVEPGYRPKLEEAVSFYAPEHRPALEEALKRAAETGEPYDLELLFIPSGGKDKIWVRAIGKAVCSSGKVVKLAGTFQNIDKYKRAEEALRETDQELRILFEELPVGISLLDQNRKMTYANQRLAEILGLSRDDLLQGKYQERRYLRSDGTPMPPEEFASVRAFRERRPIHAVETGIVVEDGRTIWTSVSAVPFPVANKGVLIATADITERKRAEEALGRLNAELERRVAERTADLESFSYSVSHDLRAPLVVVESFARILRTEHARQLDEEGRRLLDVVSANTQKMAQLIEGLLALSRLGSHELRRSRVDMGALATAVWHELVPPDEREAIRFAVGELPDAVADASLVRQVWVNLLDNALKFTAPKGDRAVEVGGRTAPGWTTYFVKDNGVGFDPVYASRLFGVFERLHPARDFPGTGAGLAIVQRIVRRHGGDVSAEGAVGEGATFRFSLPNPETSP